VSPDTQTTAERIAALRRLTPAEKLLVAGSLYQEARRLKAAGLRAQHPQWSDATVERAVRSIFLHGHPSP
jgi:hypothetical protein